MEYKIIPVLYIGNIMFIAKIKYGWFFYSKVRDREGSVRYFCDRKDAIEAVERDIDAYLLAKKIREIKRAMPISHNLYPA